MVESKSPEQLAKDFVEQSSHHDFVKQYYQTLHAKPGLMHRFYQQYESSMSHGLEGGIEERVEGQKAIHHKFMSLDLQGALVDILQRDCQAGPAGSIMIQVIGLLGRPGQPRRKFCQSFCLKQVLEKNKALFVIQNDIFRFLLAQSETSVVSAPTEVVPVAMPASAPSTAAAPKPVETTPVELPAKVPVEVPAAAQVAVAASLASQGLKPVGDGPKPTKSIKSTKSSRPGSGPPAAQATAAAANQPPNDAGIERNGKKTYAALASSKAQQPIAPPASKGPAMTAAATPAPKSSVAEQQSATAASSSVNAGPKFNSLFVRNIPASVTEEELVRLFAGVGGKTPTSVSIRASKNQPKNNQPAPRYAFVDYSDPADLEACLASGQVGKPGSGQKKGRFGSFMHLRVACLCVV